MCKLVQDSSADSKNQLNHCLQVGQDVDPKDK